MLALCSLLLLHYCTTVLLYPVLYPIPLFSYSLLCYSGNEHLNNGYTNHQPYTAGTCPNGFFCPLARARGFAPRKCIGSVFDSGVFRSSDGAVLE